MLSLPFGQFLCATAALALVGGGSGDQKSASKPAAESRESRPASRGADDVYHDRVQINLNNGQKLVGIVKNHRYAEHAEGFNFSIADKDEKDAGVRIWFSRPGQNYLFVPYKDIQSVATLARVSELEVRELEQKLYEEAKAQRDAEAEERLGELQKRAANRDGEREADAKAAAEALKKLQLKNKKAAIEKAQHMMDRFPVDQGWGEDKYKAIIAKKAKHLYPDEEESAFLKNYDDWVKAKTIVEAVDKGEEPPLPNPDEDEDKKSGSDKHSKKAPVSKSKDKEKDKEKDDGGASDKDKDKDKDKG
ncbi:MAG: hypothetical protein HY286_05120 [Planctomycetes bacterium]|nr:hypothetical protein [Planctomycetota bacterium]